MLLTAEQILALDSRSLTPELVIGRDLCRYLALELGHVPPAQRQQALLHQIEVQSPWEQPGHYVVWRNGNAQLWLWDAAHLDQRLAAADGLSRLAQMRLRGALRFPETLLRPRPADDGLRLQPCLRGLELQWWQGGVLLASRWALRSPDEAAIHWFLRSQGLDPAGEQLVNGAPELAAMPWPGARPSSLQWLRSRQRGAWVGVLLASVVLASFQATAALRWWSLERDYRQQAEALQGSAESVLQARGVARREAHRYDELRRLFNVFDPLTAQWWVASRMPQGLDYQVVIWERVGGQVEMVIQAEVTDTLGIVRALSGAGIDRVIVEPWRKAGHYSVRLQLSELLSAPLHEEEGDVGSAE